MSSNVATTDPRRMSDGDLSTAWSTRSVQSRGQLLEVGLADARSLVALEIRNPQNLTHVPLSFEISVKYGSGEWQRVVDQPELRLFHELVHSPKTFVWRAVLPRPIRADRLRLVVRQPVPGLPLTIHELVVYADDG